MILSAARSASARSASASGRQLRPLQRLDRVTLDVSDNGTGIGETNRRSGLANLRHRADHHGGALTVDSGPDGTRLAWSVPLG